MKYSILMGLPGRGKSSRSDIDTLPYNPSIDIEKIRVGISESHPNIKAINILTEPHELYNKPIHFILADKYGINYNKEKGEFKGDEQLDLICSECNEPFGIDVYNELDSLMF